MKRRDAREAVFALTFDKDFNPDVSCTEILNPAIECEHIAGWDNDEYVCRVFFGIWEHLDEIDALIDNASIRWDASRISKVSRAILRVAVYEMRYEDSIPTKISVNEAVELAKKYDDEKAFSFVNGILATVGENF